MLKTYELRIRRVVEMYATITVAADSAEEAAALIDTNELDDELGMATFKEDEWVSDEVVKCTEVSDA